LLCAIGAALLLWAAPAVAAAETIVVNTTEDGEEPPAECGPGSDEPCLTLREAIEQSNVNDSPEPDTITFSGLPAGETRIVVEGSSLPSITRKVTIEGDTSPGATPGVPGVELVQEGLGGEEFTTGFKVHGGSGTRIEGFAISGFEAGIEVGPGEGEGGGEPSDTQICGNYLGVELDGETVEPNVTGAEVFAVAEAERPGTTEIGGPGCAGNAIAGNSSYGVWDFGLETTIAGNRIGFGPEPAGLELPNGTNPGEGGAAGIFETALASGGMIGGTDPSGSEANLIWFNEGPGVRVEGSAGEISIRHDSFLENEGKAIEIEGGDQPAPTIATATTPFPETLVMEGTATGTAPDEIVELDFFGSRSCAAGEAQTYLGSGKVEEVEVGSNPYSIELFTTVPADETAITATSTREAGGTTELSTCAKYVPPPPEPGPTPEEPKKAPDQAGSTGTNTTFTLNDEPTPTNGEKVVVQPEEGKVLIKLPGSKKFVPLKELKEIPVGAVIDATKGKVRLTSIDPDGTEQSADFFGGVFKVKQREGAGLVVLELLDTNACPAPKSGGRPRVLGSSLATGSGVAARPGSGTSGKLWGSGHGNFRTEGNNGSATVRGTIWLVEDRCNGTTFFRTRRGIVSVRDFVKHKTVPLPAGKTYVAGEG
jgi:hypothetical protein